METPLSTRHRRPHAKSSGGCGTCKARRVKCDEAKPTCERCRRAQRTCTGYAGNVTKLPVHRKPYHKGFRFVNTLLGPEKVPSPKSLLSEDTDSTLVDFFTSATVPRLQSCFEDGFLKELDQKLISENEVLRHASITLCLQYMLFAPLGSAPIDLRIRCTQAYTRSLNSFQRALNSSTYNPIVTAKASVLLSTVESMRGNSSAAQAHLMGALGIMQQAFSNSTGNGIKPTMSMARSCIAKGLNLSLHTVDLNLFSAVRDFAASQADQFQDQENELLGITLLIDSIGIKIFEFMAALDLSRNKFGISLEEVQQRFMSHLDAIKEALATLKPSLRPADLPTMHILRARIKLCSIYARTAATGLQTAYDLYEEEFIAILDMIQESLDCLPRSSTDDASIVCPEIGFVTTLFSVAKLCRHPTIRRRALDMLRLGPAQEGIWNAADSRQVCQALMEFEEMDVNGSRRLYVAEENRIHHMSLRKLTSDSDVTVRKWIDIVWKPRMGMQGWERGYVELPSEHEAGDDCSHIPHLAENFSPASFTADYAAFGRNKSYQAAAA